MTVHDTIPKRKRLIGQFYLMYVINRSGGFQIVECAGNDSNLLIVFYVQIMPDDFVMQLHRF